jgi:hypothetical protein
MWDRTEQLGESEKYMMGMVIVICFHIQKVVAPACVDWASTIWPPWASSIMYWCIQDLWGPTNLVASMVAELDDTPPYLMNDTGIVGGGGTHGCPSRYRVEDLPRVRWARLDSLIVVVNCGHSWCQCDSCVSCCLVATLQGQYWFESLWHPRIWVMLVRCSHSVELQTPSCFYENYDYVNDMTTWWSRMMILKFVDWVTLHA